MFDRTRTDVSAAPAYPQEVTIKQPSPVEQLRLIREIEQEVRRDLITQDAPKNTLVNVSASTIRYPATASRVLHVSFCLNGEMISFALDPEENSEMLRGYQPHEAAKAASVRIRARIAKEITAKLLDVVLCEYSRETRAQQQRQDRIENKDD